MDSVFDRSFFPVPWVQKTFVTPLTGLSTFIKYCKVDELLEYLKRHSIIVQSIEYEEYEFRLLLANHNNDLDDSGIVSLVNNYLRSVALTFQLIALPDTTLSIPFYELQKMVSQRCNNSYTIYFSISLNLVFYCGPSEYYLNALTDINGFVSSAMHKEGPSLFSPNVSIQSEQADPILLINSILTDMKSVHSTHHTSTSSVLSDSNPEEFTPTCSIYCNGHLSYIYSNVFQTLPFCTRFVIGNGSELIDFVVVFRGDLLCNRLPPQYGQVKGFYYNRSGWYVMVQGSTRETAAALQTLYLDVSKDLQFTHRKRIQLQLSERAFIQKLIQVSELALKNIALHQVNNRDVILLGNEPWFSRIMAMLTKDRQEILVSQETQSILSSLEGLVKPICGVNSVELQALWSEHHSARGLDTNPLGFACFLTRCRRQELVLFVQTALSIEGQEGITNIIHCFEGFFLVFEKNLAPNRDRWKKYKNKINPETFGIQYTFEPVKSNPDISLVDFRDHIEQLSKGNVTLFWEERQLYIVGETSAVALILKEYSELAMKCKMDE